MTTIVSRAYKVLYVQGQYLYSSSYRYLSRNQRNDAWILEYKIGEWIRPVITNSKLFVFNSLRDVQRFSNNYKQDNFVVYSCEVTNKTFIDSEDIYIGFPNTYVDFWINQYKRLIRIGAIQNRKWQISQEVDHYIFGLVDAVKLLEQVPLEKII